MDSNSRRKSLADILRRIVLREFKQAADAAKEVLEDKSKQSTKSGESVSGPFR